nr:40S ribosomal protein S10-1-like [Tanacetum cinerariifolium]
EVDKRWNIQEEITKTFDHALKYGFAKRDNVTCCIFLSGPPREGERLRFGDRDGYRGGPRGPPGEFGREKKGALADYQPAFNM